MKERAKNDLQYNANDYPMGERLAQNVLLPAQLEQPKRKAKKVQELEKAKKKKPATIRVTRGHWSLLTHYIGIFLSLSLMATCLFAAAQLSLQGSNVGMSMVVFVGLPASLVVLSCLMVTLIIKLNNSKFEIRANCLRHVKGRYSLRQEVIEIPFEDIGWVRVSQNLVERLLNVGSIEVGATHSHNPEIIAKGRKDPHKYSAIIYRRLSKTRRRKVTMPAVH